MCPQNIELTEIFTFLKNESVKKGNAPEYLIGQAKAIFESAKAIPSQPAIERRREQLGLPSVVSPNVEEVQSIFKNTGSHKYLD